MKLPPPPKAAEKPLKIRVHGDTRVDEYAYLRDASDPDAGAYIRSENAYADAFMRPTAQLQRELYTEIRKRMKEDDMSVPTKDGPYLYYTRTKKGKQYAIHCRKPHTGGTEEVILDENVLAKGQKFFSLGAFDVSTDHRLLAYSIDTTGSERYTLYIKDLETGTLRPERIEAVSDIEWAEDGEHLFYTVEEHPHPPRKVYVHRLGEDPARDVLVYEEKDLQWYAGLDKSRSKKFIFIVSGNFDTTEVRYLPAEKPLSDPRLLGPRKKEVRYYPEHHGDHFYILTNAKAVNFKIMRAPASDPRQKNWREWMPHDIKRAVTGMFVHETFFAVTVRENGSEQVYIHAAGDPRGKKIRFPEHEHAIVVWPDLEYASDTVRITYQSLITPKTVFDYSVGTKELKTRKKQHVPRWNPSKYVSVREWAVHDGVKVPVTMVYPRSLKRDGSAPLLLEAYGSYGISNDPVFSISKLSLLKRGWILAIAHPRGGGEMGWQWHQDAKLMTKHRTHEDVIAAAEHLAKKKYSSPQRMAIVGGSAGGMMVGAVLNMRPELFGAAIAYVPAADLITSSFDESLGGTRLHYDETGDPRKPKMYRYLMKYSPYENVRAAAYPALLVRANMNDIRTPHWEAAKWVARLRAKKTDGNPLLFKTETVAGHFGRSGRYEWIKDRAFDYAFLITQLQKRQIARLVNSGSLPADNQRTTRHGHDGHNGPRARGPRR